MIQGYVCVCPGLRAGEQGCLGVGLWECVIVELCDTVARVQVCMCSVHGQQVMFVSFVHICNGL